MKHIYNDGGREAAGFKGSAGDCVVRAFCIAAELDYSETYAALAKINAQYQGRTKAASRKGKATARHGVWTNSAAFKRWVESIGWEWVPTMQIGSGCKVHLTDGELPMGRIVARVSKHLCAVIDGVIHDTHDPQRESVLLECIGGVDQPPRVMHRCVYGYYRKAEGRS